MAVRREKLGENIKLLTKKQNFLFSRHLVMGVRGLSRGLHVALCDLGGSQVASGGPCGIRGSRVALGGQELPWGYG
jgi:hypothetical protein